MFAFAALVLQYAMLHFIMYIHIYMCVCCMYMCVVSELSSELIECLEGEDTITKCDLSTRGNMGTIMDILIKQSSDFTTSSSAHHSLLVSVALF